REGVGRRGQLLALGGAGVHHAAVLPSAAAVWGQMPTMTRAVSLATALRPWARSCCPQTQSQSATGTPWHWI
ncbi:hypothetical protein, partial [Streptomyces heilongjiangensis]|uniref:hypothetical protein n=1 Tax=Streptomyces heilongjiangensis TaxID=945052 RepID=UPI002330A0EB